MTMNTRPLSPETPTVTRPWVIIAPLLMLVALTGVYLTTLQTIPNGADYYYMVDVGETQIVLNVWGTLHATGYPLYVITGNLLTDVLTAFGVPAVTAPAVVSLLWGLLALALLYALAWHLTRRALLSAAVIGVYALTRSIWIHHAIAEIYTFGLMLVALLLIFALWHGNVRYRIYALALIGGVAVAHHRAVAMMIPALLYAVWPQLTAQPRRLPRILAGSLLLGLVGFAQYLYLPLRAQTGAAWVYGEPGTLAGLWDQFIGTEANQYIGAPASLLDNFNMVNSVLITDLTLPGLALGLMGLLVAARTPRHRRTAITLILNALAAYAFHVLVYSDVLVALILPVTLSCAFGWLFLGDWLLVSAVRPVDDSLRWRYGRATLVTIPALLGLLAAVLIGTNKPFIDQLTQDTTGLETIALARQAPPDSTLMIAWGSRHFAVGVAQAVQGDLPHIQLVDHKADFAAIERDGRLFTPAFTFYDRPLSWWQTHFDAPIYPYVVAPELVEIRREDGASAPDPASICAELHRSGALAQTTDCAGIIASTTLVCQPDAIWLVTDWIALSQPEQDWSVFVHLLDSAGTLIAQADQSAPVYGFYPTSGWRSGQTVRDVYALPRLPDAATIRYGLYTQTASGTFENMLESQVDIECDEG